MASEKLTKTKREGDYLSRAVWNLSKFCVLRQYARGEEERLK